MSWIGRKLSMSDDVDQKEVVQEYFDKKMLEREKLLKEFWAEYEEEQDNGA